MNIKGCALDNEYTSYEELKRRNVVAQGWSQSGDISFFVIEKNIENYIQLIEGSNSKNAAFIGLLKKLKSGDIILAFEGTSIAGVCEIPNEFVYVFQNEYDYANAIYPVVWVDLNDVSGNSEILTGFRPPNPMFNIYRSDIHDFIEKYWEDYKKQSSHLVQPIECQANLDRYINELPKKIIDSRNYYFNLQNKINMQPKIDQLKASRNLILTGAPGTGKTFLAKEIAKQITGSNADEHNPQFAFIQFHPSYDYTDFVEGLRPEKKEDQSEIGFVLKDGIFREFCNRAKKDLKNDYVFVIDEINRGEISKIFGELFFSIDPGYRGVDGKVKTQYSNLRNLIEQFFYVPENVYIIGTMNDIDRSVESFDFAMRRRFAWYEMSAKESQSMLDSYGVWKNKNGEIININNVEIGKIKKRMNNLNNAIVDKYDYSKISFNHENIKIGLSEAYQIGASYFLKLGLYLIDDNMVNEDSYNNLWNYHLKGLLFEYLRGSQEVEIKLNALKSAYDDK